MTDLLERAALSRSSPPVRPRASASRRGDRLRGLTRHPLGLAGLGILVAVLVFCFLGPLLYHSSQLQARVLLTNKAPGSGHPLGTDANGFDILGRLMVGGRSSLELAAAVAVIATALGSLWGGIAGTVGGVLDAVMMRLVDVLISIPAIFVLIFLASVFRASVPLLIVALSLMSWPVPARLVRAEALSLRRRPFVEASRSSGGGEWRAIWRHILPNSFSTIAVNATFQVADAIVVLAGLSFLGLGLPPPAVSWGGMLASALSSLLDGYWWEVYPVLALLVLTVLAINLVGEALRDTLDVRLKSRPLVVSQATSGAGS